MLALAQPARDNLTDSPIQAVSSPATEPPTARAAIQHADVDQLVVDAMPELARVVAHYFRTPEAREDMMQDVVTHLILKHASFRGSSPYLHWALKITSNLCISKLRSNKLRRFFSLDNLLEFEPASTRKNQERETMEREDIRLLNACIDKLKPREREILVLSDFMRKDDEEVGSILSISTVNVRVRRHRARMKLKDLLIAGGYIHE